jgi:4-amino-4-deoxy-L-arabinose transferase-like glycosyltransferase
MRSSAIAKNARRSPAEYAAASDGGMSTGCSSDSTSAFGGKTKRNLCIAVLLALLAFVLVAATLDDPGVTWDEPRSFKASRGYMAWLGILRRALFEGHLETALDDAVIVRWWVQDPTLELHPPIPKLAVGLGWGLFRNLWGNIPAYRFSAAVWFGVLVALVYVSVVEAYPEEGLRSTYRPLAGLVASLSLLCMPRMFLHAHLANLDIPMATVWVLGMYLFWRAITSRGWAWTVAAGLGFGIALGTKLNALLMPLVWGICFLLWRREKAVFIKMVLIGVIGLVIFLGIWPWLYHATLERLAYYVSMGYRFGQTVQYYLGQTGRAPWHYPLVLTIAVVPVTITVAYLAGIARVLRHLDPVQNAGRSTDPAESAGWSTDSQQYGYYILLNSLVPLAIGVLGLQALYSGERHFVPVFPYLAMLAGIGFVAILEGLERWPLLHFTGARLPTPQKTRDGVPRQWQRLLAVGLVILLLAPPVVSIVRIHPYELSYYSEIVGGLPGAVRLGLETTFWCESYKAFLPYLNDNAPEGALIWVDQPLALRAYQEDGLLRGDLRITGWDVVSPFTCDYALVQMRETGFTDVPELVNLVDQYRPEFTVSVEGVTLAMLYKLR